MAKGIGVAVLGAVALALVGAGTLGVKVLLREPIRAVPSTAHATLARSACIACHQPVAEEWRQSFHHRSIAGPHWADVRREGYLEIFDGLRKRCVDCHAPANVLDLPQPTPTSGFDALRVECTPQLFREPTGVIPAARSDEVDLGVDCVACHVSRRGVVGSGKRPTPAHEVVADARFQDPRHAAVALCGICHAAAVSAWKGSTHAARGVTCLECHMPLEEAPSTAGGTVRSRRSHRFPADKDDAMLRKAFKATLSVPQPRRALLRIENDGTGHFLPTGGNWLVVRFTARDRSGRVLRQGRVDIGRAEALVLDFWPFGEDSRIPVDGKRELPFELPEGRGVVEATATYHDWHGVKREVLSLREAF